MVHGLLNRFLTMKRHNHRIELILDPDNLRLAFWKAAKGKRYHRKVLQFQSNLDIQLLRLRDEIQNNTLKVGPYHTFKIYEPKERQICAPTFKDQVLHHAIMNVCHDDFERVQIFDSYASRPGKGVHAAVNRALKFNQVYHWFLKLDVKKFFASIHHDVTKLQLSKLYKDKNLMQLFYTIIDSYEETPSRGMPIGCLTSQYLSNHYLCGLDHFIKENLQCKAYVRYMDDFVLWHNDKRVLKKWKDDINNFVADQLSCLLKPPLINRCSLGLSFLGYRLIGGELKLTHQSKHRFIRKFHQIEKNRRKGVWTEKKAQDHLLPLLDFIQKADTHKFRQKVFAFLDENH